MLQMSHVAWSVSVCWVSCAQMAEHIEMPFGRWTHVDPRNRLLDGGVKIDESTRHYEG